MKYKDENGNWKEISIKASDTLPIGSIIPYTSKTTPINWLPCNGQAVSRTDYADLFAIIGTQYGAGDGSTTFNLPDLNSYRVPIGYDNNEEQSNRMNLGTTGGEETHTLTVGEMPSHAHNMPLTSGNETIERQYNTSWLDNQKGNSGDTDSTGVRTAYAGGSQPHNNMQPYVTTNYIIKAFQSSGVVAQVSNTKSESTTDTYSCDYINGTVLYDGASNSDITLNDSAENYSYIEIFFNANNYYNSVKVYNPNNKNVYLSVNVVNADASYFQNKIALINGTSISNVVFNQNTVGSSVTTENANNIYINKVVGYK